MGRIPQSIVDQIYQADMVEVIRTFVPNLKRHKQHWVAKSPFNEKDSNPSFYVTPGKGIFKCFSSGEAGNLVNFVMAHENVEYREALVIVAGILGIQIPEDATYIPEDPAYKINSFFADTWHQNLMRNHRVLEFLIQERELTLPTIQKFKIGWCPRNLQDHPFNMEDVREANIYNFSDKHNQWYPGFWNRITYPFSDHRGRIVGFTGRILPGDQRNAKYKNSPNSKIFDKASSLYGLFENKREIRRTGKLLLVESQMSVAGLHTAGIKYTTAGSGTAFTPQQAKRISLTNDTVYLWYDADTGGQKAVPRAVKHLLTQNVIPTIVQGIEGEDPDDARKYLDIETYISQHSMGYVEYFLRKGAGTPQGKANSINALCETIASIPDEIVRAGVISHTSDVSGVSEGRLRDQVEKHIKPEQAAKVFAGDDIKHSPEYKLLRMSVHYPTRWPDMLEWIGVDNLTFENEKLNRLRLLLWRDDSDKESLFRSDVHHLFADMSIWNPVPWKDEDVFALCKLIRKKKLKKLIDECQSRISEEAKSGNTEKVEQLVAIHRQLFQQSVA